MKNPGLCKDDLRPIFELDRHFFYYQTPMCFVSMKKICAVLSEKVPCSLHESRGTYLPTTYLNVGGGNCTKIFNKLTPDMEGLIVPYGTSELEDYWFGAEALNLKYIVLPDTIQSIGKMPEGTYTIIYLSTQEMWQKVQGAPRRNIVFEEPIKDDAERSLHLWRMVSAVYGDAPSGYDPIDRPFGLPIINYSAIAIPSHIIDQNPDGTFSVHAVEIIGDFYTPQVSGITVHIPNTVQAILGPRCVGDAGRVMYTGTREQWASIEMRPDVEVTLKRADIHCSDGDILSTYGEIIEEDDLLEDIYKLRNSAPGSSELMMRTLVPPSLLTSQEAAEKALEASVQWAQIRVCEIAEESLLKQLYAQVPWDVILTNKFTAFGADYSPDDIVYDYVDDTYFDTFNSYISDLVRYYNHTPRYGSRVFYVFTPCNDFTQPYVYAGVRVGKWKGLWLVPKGDIHLVLTPYAFACYEGNWRDKFYAPEAFFPEVFGERVNHFMLDVYAIERSAFAGCIPHGAVTLSTRLTYLGSHVFEGCGDVTIEYEGTQEQWEAIRKEPDWDDRASNIKVEFGKCPTAEDPDLFNIVSEGWMDWNCKEDIEAEYRDRMLEYVTTHCNDKDIEAMYRRDY